MKPGLGSILSEIMATASLDDIWALLVRHFRQEGFGAIALVLFDRDRRDQVVAFFEDGYPPVVVQTFVERGYGRDAPLMRAAMASGRPRLANEVAESETLSQEERAHRQAILAAGLREVLALPVYGPMGRDGVVMISEPDDAGRYRTLDWAEAQIIAQAAHSRAFAVLPRRQVAARSLSRREAEILRWIAQGKSNGVIAEILGISAATVDTYLRRIFEKLEVSDRTTAAIRGVSLGFIRA